MDITQILGNLSRTVPSLEKLLSGFAYVLGILFFFMALLKFRDLAERRGGGMSESFFVPIAYLLGGAALLYLPSASQTLANTFFGSGNILAYANYDPHTIREAMLLIIHLAGLIWFIRGCVLITHASEPGVKHGPKGLMFLCAGVFAMNIETTQIFLSWAMGKILSLTLGGAKLS